MNRLTIGMLVVDIRDRHVGNVAALLDDCFQVDREHPPQTWNLTEEAIFNVDAHRATLMCEVGSLERYGCRIHRVRLTASDRAAPASGLS